MKLKFAKVKKVTLKRAKTRAWSAFAHWYRRKVTISGLATCYTCDKLVGYDGIQPGHWMTGHTNTNYINTKYIRPQCYGCNVGKKGNQGIFWERIEEEIGTDEFLYLRQHNKDFKEITVEDYLAIEKEYKEKLESLVI